MTRLVSIYQIVMGGDVSLIYPIQFVFGFWGTTIEVYRSVGYGALERRYNLAARILLLYICIS